MIIDKTRFIERDFEFTRILHNSKHLTLQQINQILDGIENWVDLTFKFYQNGSVEIIDNNSEDKILPTNLTGLAKDFYIRKRIDLIRSNLSVKTA